MEYISAAEASERWGVSLRQVQRLLAAQRIPRAIKCGRSWMIPSNAEKPADLRIEKRLLGQSLSLQLARYVETTSLPMPTHNPDAILEMVVEEKSQLHYEMDLAYLRGDFARTMRCYDKTEGDEAARLRSSIVAAAAAISLGDYSAYLEIEAYLKSLVDTGYHSLVTAYAELALATVAISVYAPNMVPGWFAEGDFSALLPLSFPSYRSPLYVLYMRAKYFVCIEKYEIALAVAQSALVFSPPTMGITSSDIYLRVVCALACHYLGQEDKAKRWLLEAMSIALPHGFTTPFAEHITSFGGLMEQCLEEAFPDCRDAILEQGERTVKNWFTFHNHFARDNITLILTLREIQLAELVARRVPYTKIAKQYNISVGRLKNIMLEIYEKLYISSRDKLAQCVLLTNKEVES